MTKKELLIIGCQLLLLMLLTACGSPRTAQTGADSGAATMVNPTEHMTKVASNQSGQQYLTAKVKVDAQTDNNHVSTSGTLRMKRDDVIQLILVDPLIGALELGRMEFTKTHVLIIDKVNKQYIDVPYSDVSFLQRAGITFSTLQSLFWNEVFTTDTSKPSASDFLITSYPDHVDMARASGMLAYSFSTIRSNGRLTKTEITGTNDDTYTFRFLYSNFQNYEGRPFPKDMTMQFQIGTQPASLAMSLSSMRNASDWVTRSSVSSKYTKADPERILRSLL